MLSALTVEATLAVQPVPLDQLAVGSHCDARLVARPGSDGFCAPAAQKLSRDRVVLL